MTRVRRVVALFGIVWRTYRWRGIRRRGLHECRRKISWFKDAPRVRVAQGLDTPFSTYRPDAILTETTGEARRRAIDRGKRVLAGTYQPYGFGWRPLPGDDDWHTHPESGFRFPLLPWWKVPHLPPGTDIKDVWEPARFGWAYDLVRAYAITADARFAEAFHHRLASWTNANPPFLGVHWSCGQEVAIRAIALLHAADGFGVSSQASDEDGQRLWSVLGWSGERIADAIEYGLSQRNNHGVSEAAGLVHLGLRLRGHHPDAEKWLRRGQVYLEEQLRDQIADDGWYAQHSFNYARVALEQALLAQRVLRANGQALSAECLERLRRCAGVLANVVSSDTGHVPNHGANDGARIAPLSTAEYRDFRPVLTLASIILDSPLPGDIAPDADIARWCGVATMTPGPPRVDGALSGASGWAVVRVAGTMLFVRAGSYVHRPSHMDLLHLDLQLDGKEVIVDPGTFTYNGASVWKDGFVSATVHNGPVLDGHEPAERGPRFLWYTWPAAKITACDYRDGAAVVIAEVPRRVRRTIKVDAATVTVTDEMIDAASEMMQVTWLLHPVTDPAIVDAAGAQPLSAGEHSAHAWFCPTYGQRVPTQSLQIRANRPARIVTVFHRTAEAA